jgi:hypothetical protein
MASQTMSFVGIASNPFHRLCSHNRIKGYPAGAKSTRSGAPDWKLKVIVGPFLRGAHAFHACWKEHSRKLHCRIAFGTMKAQKYRNQGLRVWADNVHECKQLSQKLLSRSFRRAHTLQHLNAAIPLETPQPSYAK